jgi:hypothetical protein
MSKLIADTPSISPKKRKDVCNEINKHILSRMGDSIRGYLTSENPLPDESYIGDNTFSFKKCLFRIPIGNDKTSYSVIFRVDIRIKE